MGHYQGAGCPPPIANQQKAHAMVFVILAVVIAGIAIVGGGNTLSGFGRDTENTGEKIQRAAD